MSETAGQAGRSDTWQGQVNGHVGPGGAQVVGTELGPAGESELARGGSDGQAEVAAEWGEQQGRQTHRTHGLNGRRAARQLVALTDRDTRILQACSSLGAAPASALRALTSPQTGVDTFRHRLSKLVRAGYLDLERFVAPDSGLWLYSLGRATLEPGEPRPWRPGLPQLGHTLAVADAVVALMRPGFAAPYEVTGWQGEAELRGWAAPGAPYPDALVSWQHGDTRGSWSVEVDRGTETKQAWRRKLVRYLTHRRHDPVLALTTSQARAAGLANEALDVGVPLLATTLRAVQDDLDPLVLDTRAKAKHRLSQVLPARPHAA